MAANVESMFSVRETPWHGLGKIVQDAPTAEEAIVLAGLDWTVKQEPSGYILNKNFISIPDQFVNLRSSDNKYLGTVSKDYKIFNNVEAFSFLDSLTNEGLKFETAGCLYNGKVWLLARMPETEIVGEKTERFLLLSLSHDGKSSIRLCCTMVRVVCQNTLSLALSSAERSWFTRHKGDIQGKVEEAQRTLQLSSAYQKAYEDEALRLAAQKFSMREFKIFVETLIPSAKEDATPIIKARITDQRDMLHAVYEKTPDLNNIRGTKWGVLQAVSDFVNHKEPLRKTDTYRDSQLDSLATGNKMLDKAYEILSA